MEKTIFIFLLLISSQALAATGGGEHGVPAGTVISQIVNLGLLIALIYFWQGKAIAKAFRDKKESFLNEVAAASKSKSDAEAKMKEVEKRVQDLVRNFDKDVAEAKQNAEASYKTQVENAKAEAGRIKSSALGSLDSEVQKEIENLRLETFKKSAGLAEQKLENNLSADQQKAWNGHFAKAAKGVH